jgi:glycerol-3-phosphate dehydrogenase
MDNPSHKPIVQPSSGVHITLPNYYSPRTMGLLDPATSDGRVIFFLPWEGGTIAGTTDAPAPVEREPRATEDEISWVLKEVRRYLSPDIKVRRVDVLSAWSGLRPLVRNPAASNTEGLVRNHIIHVSPSGLLTIAGGKWTTYRAMAEETVNKAIETFGLENRTTNGCLTEHVRLVGSDAWNRNMFIRLIQRVRSFLGFLSSFLDCEPVPVWSGHRSCQASIEQLRRPRLDRPLPCTTYWRRLVTPRSPSVSAISLYLLFPPIFSSTAC